MANYGRVASMTTRAWKRLAADPKRAHKTYRWLERLPGVFVWVTLLLSIIISIVWPVAAIAFILLFDVYWLVRILYIMSFVLLAYRRYGKAVKHDWLGEVKTIQGWDQIWHLILVPTATEPKEVLAQTLQSLTKIHFPRERCLVILATEERTGAGREAGYRELVAEYEHQFGGLLWTIHPGNIAGEVAGKGANIAWAGKKAKEWFDAKNISYPNIIVSTFDADSIAHPQYFAYLTATYLRHPNRLRTSYQPIPLFHNNVWETLPWMRVVSTSTTFWLMGDTMRPDRLFTFSSHSMSFQALVDVDFWQTDVVSEDSRIFLQCLIHYDGDYTVTPMYIPISMDVVDAPTWWEGTKNQYKQIRRWAYGVENVPFMIWNFGLNEKMAWTLKARYLWYQVEGVYSWAVAPLLITIMGWLPFQVQRETLNNSLLAHNAPMALQWLMLAAMVGAIVSAWLFMAMLPDRPRHIPRWQWLVMGLQWALLPITMVIFGSIPAIEAQTRLMLGKYLGFWVTDKIRR